MAVRTERALSYTMAVNGWAILLRKIMNARLTRRMARYQLYVSPMEARLRLGNSLHFFIIFVAYTLDVRGFSVVIVAVFSN